MKKEGLILFILGCFFGVILGYIFGRGMQENLEMQLLEVESYIMNSMAIEYTQEVYTESEKQHNTNINLDCLFDYDTPHGPNCK